jgi:hypothetical protein
MKNKHLHNKVLCFYPDDDVHFDHSLDDHDYHLCLCQDGSDWCGWQGAVYVGFVDDHPLAHLPGDAHLGCHHTHHGPATICKNKIYLIRVSAAYLILFQTPLFQYLVHSFLITAILIWVLGSSLLFLHTMAKSRTFPD